MKKFVFSRMVALLSVVVVVGGCADDGPPAASDFGGGFVADVASTCDPSVEVCPSDAVSEDTLALDTDAPVGGDAEDVSEDPIVDGGNSVDSTEEPGDVQEGDVAIPLDTPEVDAGGPVVEEGGIGSSCTQDGDCSDEGAVCVEWPEGSSYCTVIDCDQGVACPLGSVCIMLSPATWGCALACEKSGDCSPGYPCKTLLQASGALVSVCHAVSNKAGGPAQLCDHAIDCKAKAACITDWPGGYCAVLGCSAGKPCPSGTSCVETEDVGNACLKNCDPTKPCPGEIPKLQHCAPATTLSGEEEDVCLIGETGKDLGEFCMESDECLSGDCKLTSIGKCADDGSPCLGDSDCGDGAPCDEDPAYVAGVCVQGCDESTPCPEGTVCVPLSSSQGECRKACQSLADNFTCDKPSGETCEYGIPLGAAMDGGAYVCTTVTPGQVGQGCIGDLGLGCENGLYCYPGPGSSGMCISACGSSTPGGVFYCPWTAACASIGGTSQCVKLCPYGGIECPEEFECKHIEFGVLNPFDVCAPGP